MDEHKLYILLSDTKSVISKGIKLYTRKQYSHVSIALDENLEELYSFGRLKPHNPLIGGFVREDIDNGTFNLFPNTECALYSINVTTEQLNQVREVIHRFKYSYQRYGYNFLGIIGLIINKPISRKYSYFCSQFVAEVLYDSGINIIDKEVGLTLPEDFKNSEDLKLIYEGSLHKYDRRIQSSFN